MLNRIIQDDINNYDKVERARELMKDMEQKANRKIELMKSNNKVNPNLFNEASDMFISSIKAKLCLLDKIN